MNVKEFIKKYSDHFTNYKLSNDSQKITDITVRLDNAKAGDIVFYNRRDDAKSSQVFKERLSSAGCSLLICNHIDGIEWDGNIAACSNLKALSEQVVKDIYPVDKNKKLVGVTGTNGKSTVVHLCRELAELKGTKAISIGTLGVIGEKGKEIENTGMTSPSFIDCYRILNRYENEYDLAFFEISSHALDQERFKGLEFEEVAWTNLTQDHLDYHKTMEHYFNSKLKIARLSKKKRVLVSSNEDLQRKLDKERVDTVLSSTSESYPGVFKAGHNKENISLVITILKELGHDVSMAELEKLSMPNGRFQEVEQNGVKVIIDYAHTPDAIENILKSTQEVYPDKKRMIVFGCGGDRDPSKRHLMGQAACKFSDIAIVTSDNPRFEEPKAIVNDIVKKLNDDEYIIEVEREKAIEKAISLASDSWVIIVAGKGHETYQEIRGIKNEFNDLEMVKKYLSK